MMNIHVFLVISELNVIMWLSTRSLLNKTNKDYIAKLLMESIKRVMLVGYKSLAS